MRWPAVTAGAVLVLAMAATGSPGRARAFAAGGPSAGRPAATSLEPGTVDHLLPMLQRIHHYLRSHEVEGITMDSRYSINPSEAIRMGVVCQLLGYTELSKLRPGGLFRREILAHARFLASRLDSVRSHGPFDGMLGYSLTQAVAQTRDTTWLPAAREVALELRAIPTEQCVLNGGLMVALAMADWANLTGDAVARQKAADIVAQLVPYQNADGSFPHWCFGSKDIHYTGWMAEELVLLERMTGDVRIAPMLARMRAFIESRLDSTGVSSYSAPCEDQPECTEYFDSQHSGCGYDYDTRGWTVEPAYNAQLLDYFDSPAYVSVMGFLRRLENGGTWSDKYGYIPPPDDAEYPWSIADTSVANTSINFWILATVLTNRARRGPAEIGWLWNEPAGDAAEAARRPAPVPRAGLPAPPRARLDAPVPSPARGPCTLRFATPAREQVALTVFDAGGRRVRDLVRCDLAAGEHEVVWDARDERGAASPAGVYFVRLRAGEDRQLARLVLRP